MIPLSRIIKMIRFKQNDNNEIKYSDYDIISAVNECLRYINQAFSLKNSDFLEKIKEYREVEVNEKILEYNKNLTEGETPLSAVIFAVTGVDLPDDYLGLVSVVRSSDGYALSPITILENLTNTGYKIFSNKIYCSGDFNLLYKRTIAEVKGVDIENEHIDLPLFFIDLVVKLSGVILQNSANTDVMMSEINSTVERLIPNRRYSKIKRKMPF